MNVIALYRETISTLATLSTFNEIRTFNENSRKNKKSKNKSRNRNRNKQLTQNVSANPSNSIFQEPIFSNANNSKSTSDSKNGNGKPFREQTSLNEAISKNLGTPGKSHTVLASARITAFNATQEMSQDDTLHLTGNNELANNFPEACNGDAFGIDSVIFDVGNGSALGGNSDNISSTSRCSVSSNHDGKSNSYNKMDTNERDRKRKRYLSDQDCTRTTRQKQQHQQLLQEQELLQKQTKHDGRLVEEATMLPKKSRVIVDNATKYSSSCNNSSPNSSGTDVHSRMIRSSLCVVKQDFVATEVGKICNIMDRKRILQADSGRVQSECAITCQKRAEQIMSEKQDFSSSDFSDGNDEHENYEEGNELSYYEHHNDNAADEEGDEQGVENNEVGVLSTYNYKPIEILIDGSRMKISKQERSPSLTNACCNFKQTHQVSEVEDGNKIYIDDDMHADAKRDLGIKPRSKLAWEANLAFNNSTKMSLSNKQNLRDSTPPPPSYEKIKSSLNAGENNFSVGQNYCYNTEASVTDENAVATRSKNINDYEGNNTKQHQNSSESSQFDSHADKNNASKNEETFPGAGDDNANDSDGEHAPQKLHRSNNSTANAARKHLATSLASTLPTSAKVSGTEAEHSHAQYLVAPTTVPDAQSINNPSYANAVNLNSTTVESHQYTGKEDKNEEKAVGREKSVHNASRGDNSCCGLDDKGSSFYADQHGYRNSVGMSMQSGDRCEHLFLSTEYFSAAGRTIETENPSSTTRNIFTTTTTITTNTEGCVSTNVTNKFPNSDAITATELTPIKMLMATTISTAPLSTAKLYVNKADGCEVEKLPGSSTIGMNVNLTDQGAYKMSTSSESLKIATPTYLTQDVNENITSNERSSPWAHTNDIYRRYSNIGSGSGDRSGGENVTESNESRLTVEMQLCHKVEEDSSVARLTENGKIAKHQQQPENGHSSEHRLANEQQQKEKKEQQPKNKTDKNYDTPQSSDTCSSLGTTRTYTAEIALHQQREQQQRQLNQDEQHYIQEHMCQQLQQQQLQRLLDHPKEQQLQLNIEEIRLPQDPQHDSSYVSQHISFHDHHLRTHAHSVPFQDAKRRSQQQHLVEKCPHNQDQRRDEEQQQQHLIAYLHHTSEQSRLQQQPQHNAAQHQQEYHQQHYQRQQPQKLQHNQQQQHLRTSFLLTSHQHLQPQQQQQQLQQQIPTDLKRLNGPPPTSIEDLIIDEFSEDPHAAYKLGLSPNNVKHENQDDGYETSAGDVLTPNSHSSSTHSVTPQHQMQHAINLIPPSKYEEHQSKMQQPQHTVSDVFNQQQQQTQDKTLTQRVRTNISTDQYTFMNEDIATTTAVVSNTSNPRNDIGSNIVRESQPSGHGETNRNSDVATSFMSSAASVMGQAEEIFSMQHQDQQSKQQFLARSNDLKESMEYSLKMKLSSAATSMLSRAEQDQELHPHVQHNQQLPQQLPTQSTQFVFNDNNAILRPPQKKRGRKKKIQPVPNGTLVLSLQLISGNSGAGGTGGPSSELAFNLTDNSGLEANVNAITGQLKAKERKKHDRFNGMSEEDVIKRTLPDHLCDNLDIVIKTH